MILLNTAVLTVTGLELLYMNNALQVLINLLKPSGNFTYDPV
jgi:hypothetical protein